MASKNLQGTVDYYIRGQYGILKVMMVKSIVLAGRQ